MEKNTSKLGLREIGERIKENGRKVKKSGEKSLTSSTTRVRLGQSRLDNKLLIFKRVVKVEN